MLSKIAIVFLCFSLFAIKGLQAYHDLETRVGYGAVARENSDSVNGKSIIPDAEQTFDEDGKIISFNYYSTEPDVNVKFQIWRPQGGSRYKLIYQSESITTEDDSGSYTYDVGGNQWGQAGDTVGIYVADANPLPYDADASCTLMDYPLQAGSASEGDTKSFSEITSSECRQYSLNVDVVYESVSATDLNCTTLDAESSYQYLESENYDGLTEYLDSTRECWIFDAGNGDNGIRISFEILNFEDPYSISGECANDFLEFHDGNGFWDEVLEEYCGTTAPTTELESTGRYMYLRMTTDDNGVNGLGFRLLYQSFPIKEKKGDDSINVAMVLCIVFAVIALLLIIPIIILWVRTKRQRDEEARDRLKENDFLQLEKNTAPAWKERKAHQVKTPRPRLNIDQHRENFLRSKEATVPEAAEYNIPREPEGADDVKVKHWSALTAGVRWNPIKKQFPVQD